jgi:hypothetical protein
MMITLRYHIITISAVFLSLGLGILLGGSIGQNWINEKQQTLLLGLEEKYDEAVKSNEQLQNQIQELSIRIEQANQEFSTFVSNGYLTALQGRTIGVWQEKGLDISQVKGLLSSAGLKVITLGDKEPKESFAYPVIFVGQTLPSWSEEIADDHWFHLPDPLLTPSKQWELLRKLEMVYKENQDEY